MSSGLYNERTTLAWSRSGLSLAAVGALAAKQSGGLAVGIPLLVAVGAVAALMVTHAERRHHRRHQRPGPVAVPGELLVTAGAVVLLALASLAIVVG